MGYHKLFIKELKEYSNDEKLVQNEYRKIVLSLIRLYNAEKISSLSTISQTTLDPNAPKFYIEIKEYNPNNTAPADSQEPPIFTSHTKLHSVQYTQDEVEKEHIQNLNQTWNTLKFRGALLQESFDFNQPKEVFNLVPPSLELKSIDKIFFLLDKQILVTSTNFKDMICEKLKRYTEFVKVTIEGEILKFGDFTVRVGIYSYGTKKRGILIDVEYSPCSYCYLFEELMKDFMTLFVDFDSNTPTPSSAYQQNTAKIKISDLYNISIDYADYSLPHNTYTLSHYTTQLIKLMIDCGILKATIPTDSNTQ
ncbi:predicted protein [Naegleria gruberi]|uniref:Mediator of RNA polymerase II transcription subunit 20 n=1 Tax=Naegleria gruberi TaxID=5762 RepID=D2V6R6_NAEGR|nr:uncharacterized protein NAEGRDRAFT_64535 [Naegleria gruberi]EFC47625.1 predicted protein [Naegleria gruberi]|eukprot:XP_002680369.1 predicted protein [Naegleria gruberi strain NEG-M]